MLGLGRHTGCSSMDADVMVFKLMYVTEMMRMVSTVFARISVTLFVIRLFAVTKLLQRLLLGYTIFMVFSLGALAFVVFAQCRPIEALWTPALQSAVACWPWPTVMALSYLDGAIAILSDLVLALLPAYFIHQQQMHRRLKLRVASLMAIGLLPAVCATGRTVSKPRSAGDDPLCMLDSRRCLG
jgi:hypothetical protein